MLSPIAALLIAYAILESNKDDDDEDPEPALLGKEDVLVLTAEVGLSTENQP